MLVRRRPESWIWLVVIAAWVAMLAWSLVGAGGVTPTGGSAHHHHGSAAPGADGGLTASLGVAALGWLLMIMAMMLPVVVPVLYRVVVDTLPRRRVRAISLVLVGYTGLWCATGVVALLIILPLTSSLTDFGSTALVVIMLVVAAGYELSPIKRRALRRCALGYRLPPRGVAADQACLRAGLRHGRACLTSCAALMGVLLVAGHSDLALLVLITALIWAQRLLALGPRLRWWGAAALGTAAIMVAIG